MIELIEALKIVKEPKSIHLLMLILPPINFYLMGITIWIFLSSIVISTLLFVYQLDLKNKTSIISKRRINEIKKGKKLLRHWKEQIKDCDKEFNYMYHWKFFGFLSVLFYASFIYSAVLAWNYDWRYFGIHLAIMVFVLFLKEIINFNWRYLEKKGVKK